MSLLYYRRLTSIKQIINTLWKDGVVDEDKAISFYNFMAKELAARKYYKEADIIKQIAADEQLHKDLLNEIIHRLRFGEVRS